MKPQPDDDSLEEHYAAAAEEWESSGERDLWEPVVADGV